MYQTIKFVKYNKLNQCILKIQSMLKHLCKWPVAMSQSSKLPRRKKCTLIWQIETAAPEYDFYMQIICSDFLPPPTY